jgi:AP2-associated kinase
MQRKEKIQGTVWELEQGMLASNSSSASSDAKTWQAFPDTKTQARPKVDHATNGSQNITKNTSNSIKRYHTDQQGSCPTELIPKI